MKQSLVGAALAGSACALMALPVTTMAAVVKPPAPKIYPVTLVFTPGPGQTPKVSLFSSYFLSFGPAGAAKGDSIVSYTVMTKSNITAEGICNIKSSNSGLVEVKIDNAGTCTIAASLSAPDGSGRTVVGAAQYTFQVPKADMIFAEYDQPLPTTALVGDAGMYFINTSYNPAQASPSLSITSLTPAICSVGIEAARGLETLTTTYNFKALAAGTCTISYSTADTGTFRAFSTTKTVTITDPNAPVALKGEQSIVFPAFAAPLVGQSVTLSASGGASGNPVSFSSNTPAICSVEGRNLTALAVGTCTVAADQLGNDKFNNAPQKTLDLNIVAAAKPSQAITFGPLSPLAIGETASLTATGGDSGNAVTFSSKTPAICSVEGDVLTGLADGACIVAADQPGNDQWGNAPQVTQTITVGAGLGATKTVQTITFGDAPALVVGGSAFLSAKGGDSGNSLTYSSLTPDICTVSGDQVSAVAAGSCIVAADQAGNDNFEAAAQATQTLTVSAADGVPPAKKTQSITLSPLSPILVGSTATINATGGDSGNPLSFSSSTTDICTVSGNTLTAVAAGTCTVTANQDGNESFEAATSATLDVSIATEITPFSINVSVAGDLTAQTMSASIKPASSDIGKNGSEFLAAQLGDLYFLYGAGGWVQYTGADSLVALSTGVLASHELILLENVDMTPLLGAQIFVGYGLGDSLADAYDDMQKAGRLMAAYKVE